MRCTSYCTAKKYLLKPLADFFKSQHYITVFYRDILHLSHTHKNFEIFVFASGCIVAWGLTQRKETELLTQIQAHALEPLESYETDRFIFLIGDKTQIITHRRLKADVIRIEESEAHNVQVKLAISYGLAQSVKLQVYEESIQKTIENNQYIPTELAKTGSIPLSRKAISKHIGQIFTERSSVNLSSDYFDVPEYFWEHPSLEIYYTMTEQFLDVPKRVAVLNRKLDVLHELFDVLNNQLQHRYASNLEIIIIALIFIEIVINVLTISLV